MAERSPRGATTSIRAELAAPGATIQLVSYDFVEPPESLLRCEGKFRVELCLTSRHRSARACFRDAWSHHRFERIGDLFMVPPSLDMVTKADEARSLSAIVCTLERESVLALHDTVPKLTDQILLAALDIRDLKIRGLMMRLAEEARHPGLASQMLVDLLVQQLAIELVRYGTMISDLRRPCGLASWQLRLIDERLKEVRETPGLSGLADLCRISVRQLTRGFRASRGCSLGAYVAGNQMEHAKRLLASDESVASIAASLGFASSSNFCFAFRRATGRTPGQFRQTLLRH